MLVPTHDRYSATRLLDCGTDTRKCFPKHATLTFITKNSQQPHGTVLRLKLFFLSSLNSGDTTAKNLSPLNSVRLLMYDSTFLPFARLVVPVLTPMLSKPARRTSSKDSYKAFPV